MNQLLGFLNRVDPHDYMVIVDDVSRFARDYETHKELRNKIVTAGAAIDSPKTKFGVDAESRILEMPWALLASRDREKNAELSKNRTIARLKNGYWTFAAPIGYEYAKAPGGGKILVRKNPEAHIIQDALEGFAAGRFQSQSEVKRYLESNPEFPRPKGAKEIKFDRVTRLLTRMVYAGYLEKNEWGVPLTKAQHEPLISYDTFLINQDRFNGNKVSPARKDIDRDFVLRGFLVYQSCGYSLTSCWSKRGTGKRYPYYLCHHKGCSERGKPIPRDKLEKQFETMLKNLRPSERTYDLASKMFRDAWSKQRSNSREDSRKFRVRLNEISDEVETKLDRAARTQHEETAMAYESRIAELRSEAALLEEKTASQKAAEGNFEEMFELSMSFLSSPYNLWEKSTYEVRRTVQRLAFAAPKVTCRDKGLRTGKISFPFKALRILSTSESKVVRAVGLEPTRAYALQILSLICLPFHHARTAQSPRNVQFPY